LFFVLRLESPLKSSCRYCTCKKYIQIARVAGVNVEGIGEKKNPRKKGKERLL